MFRLQIPMSPQGYNTINAVALRHFNMPLVELATRDPWAAYNICRAYTLAQAEKAPSDISLNGQEIANPKMDGEFAAKALARYLTNQFIPPPNTSDVEVMITDLSSGKVILSFSATPV